MTSILIVNQPLNNRGDESAHRSFMKGLNQRLPDAKLTVLFESANDNSIEAIRIAPEKNRYLNINKGILGKGRNLFRRIALRSGLMGLSYIHPGNLRAARLIGKADLVICAPGGVCMGPYKDWNHVYLLALAKSLGKKVAYYSRSFGPFLGETGMDRAFERVSRELLHYFGFISIRDSKTMALADSLGLRYVPSIDTAFLDHPEQYVPPEVKKQIGDDYVIFVPNALTWSPVYKNVDPDILIQFYIEILKLLLQTFEKANVVMLPQLFNSTAASDETYFLSILKYAGSDRVIVLSEKYGSDIQQAIVSGAKLVIGARYHSIVFAINNNISFVSLSYEHKMSGMTHSLGLDDQNVDIETVKNGEVNIPSYLNQIKAAIHDAKPSPESSEKARGIAADTMNALVDFILASKER